MAGRALWVAVLVALTAGPVQVEDKLTVRVAPRVVFAPGRIVVRATSARDANNRAVRIVAASPEYYRGSTVYLEGDRAPITTEIQFRGLPRGEYRVSTHLLGPSDEVLAVVHRTIVVTAREEIDLR